MSINHSSSIGNHDIEEPWRYADGEAALARAYIQLQMNSRHHSMRTSPTTEQIDAYIEDTERRFHGVGISVTNDI